MKVTRQEEFSESKLTIVLDITKDDCEEIYTSYCVQQGYKTYSENLIGNELTVELKKEETKKYI